MIIDGHGQLLLGDFLADNVLIQKLFDLLRFWELLSNRGGNDIVSDDLIAHVDTLIADVNCRTCNEFSDLVLAL